MKNEVFMHSLNAKIQIFLNLKEIFLRTRKLNKNLDELNLNLKFIQR
jgi:hypothetical protein